MEPLISVIIPVFNMEKYLSRCLDSILSNTYHNLEIICVDDGSTDRSLEILREYEAKDERFRVITKENGGVSSARNLGMDQATGAFISFIDPDDFIHEQYFEILIEAIAQTNADVVCCSFRSVQDKDLPIETEHITFNPEALQIYSTGQIFLSHNLRSFCWGKLLRSDLLSETRFREDMNYSEDSVFIAEVWERRINIKTAIIPDLLYFYYYREASLVKQARVLDRMKAAEIYTAKALQSTNNDFIYLDQAVKRCLSTRYFAVHIQPDRNSVKKCRELLNACRRKIKDTKIYSSKEKHRYFLFIRFPGIYWLYRSITEPYMWKWEMVERKKRRKAEKLS